MNDPVQEYVDRKEDADNALSKLWDFYLKHPRMELYLRLRRVIAKKYSKEILLREEAGQKL